MTLTESAALYENVLREASAHRARMGERRSIELDARIDERLDVLRQNITRIMTENERLRLALSDITVTDTVAEIHEIASAALGERP